MKRKERNWMYNRLDGNRRLRNEFVNGVEEFVGFCLEHPACNDKDIIRCTCVWCDNKRFFDTDTIKVHLYKKDFTPNYYEWLCHGETVGGSSSTSVESNPYQEMILDALGNHEDNYFSIISQLSARLEQEQRQWEELERERLAAQRE